MLNPIDVLAITASIGAIVSAYHDTCEEIRERKANGRKARSKKSQRGFIAADYLYQKEAAAAASVTKVTPPANDDNDGNVHDTGHPQFADYRSNDCEGAGIDDESTGLGRIIDDGWTTDEYHQFDRKAA